MSNISRFIPLIAYPDELSRARALVLLEDLALTPGLALLRAHLRDTAIEELQEYYTRTFEVNPVCCLELGWHIYGEQYERGVLMAKLRRAMADVGLAECAELPDHLSNVLTLLDALPARDAALLAGAIVIPAVSAMIDGFAGDKRVADVVMDLTLKKRDRLLLEKDDEKPSRNVYKAAMELILSEIEAMPGASGVEKMTPRQKQFIPPWEEASRRAAVR